MPDLHSANSPEVLRTTEFVRLYTAHSRRVYTYLLTLLPNRADAEEVMQEISVTLWEKFDEYTPGSNFAAWACKVALFKARQFIERTARRSKHFSHELLALIEADLVAADDSLDAEYAALADCLAQLSTADRELIEHRYRADGDPQQLAERWQQPVAQIYRGLARIRRALMLCVNEQLVQRGDV